MWFAMLIHGLFTGAFGASWVRTRSSGAALCFILFFAGTIWVFVTQSAITTVANLVGIALGAFSMLRSRYV